MLIRFHCHKDTIEPKEVDYQQGQTVRQLFRRFVEEEALEDELDFQPQIEQVIIVLKDTPTKRIHPDDSVQKLSTTHKRIQLQFLVVYPSEGGALLQFMLDGQGCYFESFVNKSDALESYILVFLKKMNIETEVEIKVNGKINNPEIQLEKKSIKKIISGQKNAKILVEISTKSKSNMAEKESKSEKRNEEKNIVKSKPKIEEKINQREKEKVQIEEKKDAQRVNVLQQVKQTPQQPQRNEQIVRKPKSRPKAEINRQIIKGEKPKQSPQKKPSQKQGLQNEDQKYQFLISFETNLGKRSHSFDVRSSDTMLEILPKILKSLNEAGFDWDPEWTDYQVKLIIFYGSSEYMKLDKKIRQILPSGKQLKPIEFQFRRKYDGG